MSTPKPPEAEKEAPTKPEADKAAEKRGEKKSDEQLKREEEDIIVPDMGMRSGQARSCWAQA